MGYGIAVENVGEVDLYRFGRSNQVFRGPKPSLKKPYIAFIGGSEPFGKFVSVPFPKLVQRGINQACVNWGTPGAGPGFFLKDPIILEACSNSSVCVIQVMDAAPLSNRMYSVFPRRNMRLRGVSDVLKALYPQINFDNFKYVRGMLRKLKDADSKAYDVVVAEQRSAWIARMLELLEDIETQKILLWLAPDDTKNSLVNDEMIDVVSSHVDRLVKVSVPDKRRVDLFNSAEKDSGWMTRSVHKQVADTVAPELVALLSEEQKLTA